MADRSIVARLRLEVSEWKRGTSEAKAAVDQVTKSTTDLGAKGGKSFSDVLGWVNKNEASLSRLSMQAGLLGAGLTAAAGIAIKKFADFDQAMSGVQAATMETAQGMEQLRAAALKAGADTMYTASDAAAAITDLAKAGVSTSDILKGGLMGSLNLAAAAQMDVAQAAEITATAMNQFGLEGKDASHISDLLAAAAGKAMGDVTDMAG
ncbi:MAG TPA: phage tail tape measure protein, partial [Candidatus Limnocylindrales bacterium]